MNERTTLWFMLFAGFAVNFMIRINLNICIVSMVEAAGTNHEQQQSSSNLLNWTKEQQLLVVGSFLWFYWCTPFLGGLLSHHYGTKHVFGMGNFVSTVLCCLIPVTAYWNFNVLVAIRVIQGFMSGLCMPAMHSMGSKWVPPSERSTFASAFYGGSVGASVMYVISGVVVKYLSWEYVFYITSIIGTLWYIVWCIYVYETPETHPTITADEKKYIIESISKTKVNKKLPIPWRKICTSKTIYTLWFTQWAIVWSVTSLQIYMPMYLNQTYRVSITVISLCAAISNVGKWLCSVFSGVIADYFIKREIVGVTLMRKIMCCICTFGRCIPVLILSLNTQSSVVDIVMFMITSVLHGSNTSSTVASLIDISPNFASVLCGMSATISATSGILLALTMEYLSNNAISSAVQFKTLYLMTAIILFVAGLLYVSFGSAKTKAWNFNNVKSIVDVPGTIDLSTNGTAEIERINNI